LRLRFCHRKRSSQWNEREAGNNAHPISCLLLLISCI
jgi:hypothetical protein